MNDRWLLLVSGAAAFAYLAQVRGEPSLARSLIKSAAVGCLAAFAALAGKPMWLVAGLALGSLGDWFLSRDGDRNFLCGLAAFLVAHLAYAALFLELAPGNVPNPARLAVAGLFVGLAALMAPRLWRAAAFPMDIAVSVYVAAITAMGLAAASSARSGVMAGALLFAMSDALIGCERFLWSQDAPPRAWSGHVIWVTYVAAQALFLASV
jgi:uncharacterized membrane protein YhhN